MNMKDKFRLHAILLFATILLVFITHAKGSGAGIRECSFVSEGPMMCDGVPYFEQVVSTPGFCEMYRCQTDDECDGFTFFASENRCALYKGCNEDNLARCPEDETCLTGICQDTYHDDK